MGIMPVVEMMSSSMDTFSNIESLILRTFPLSLVTFQLSLFSPSEVGYQYTALPPTVIFHKHDDTFIIGRVS